MIIELLRKLGILPKKAGALSPEYPGQVVYRDPGTGAIIKSAPRPEWSREQLESQYQPTPTPTPEKPNIEDAIQEGLRMYSEKYAGGEKLPIEPHISTFAEAAKNYPILEKYPYLLPQVSILESSGGRNVTRENNPLNWAARVQKVGDYAPTSWEQSIRDAITAIGGDVEARPTGARRRTLEYYQPFRETGDIAEFAKTYEPANREYLKNLIEGMKVFEEIEKRKRQ